MIREIRDIKDFLKLAIDCHLADWEKLHAAFDRAFDDLERRFERLESNVAKLEAERQEAASIAAE